MYLPESLALNYHLCIYLEVWPWIIICVFTWKSGPELSSVYLPESLTLNYYRCIYLKVWPWIIMVVFTWRSGPELLWVYLPGGQALYLLSMFFVICYRCCCFYYLEVLSGINRSTFVLSGTAMIRITWTSCLQLSSLYLPSGPGRNYNYFRHVYPLPELCLSSLGTGLCLNRESTLSWLKPLIIHSWIKFPFHLRHLIPSNREIRGVHRRSPC